MGERRKVVRTQLAKFKKQAFFFGGWEKLYVSRNPARNIEYSLKRSLNSTELARIAKLSKKSDWLPEYVHDRP